MAAMTIKANCERLCAALRAARTPSLAHQPATEPGGAVMPGQAASAPSGSETVRDAREEFLRLARAL